MAEADRSVYLQARKLLDELKSATECKTKDRDLPGRQADQTSHAWSTPPNSLQHLDPAGHVHRALLPQHSSNATTSDYTSVAADLLPAEDHSAQGKEELSAWQKIKLRSSGRTHLDQHRNSSPPSPSAMRYSMALAELDAEVRNSQNRLPRSSIRVLPTSFPEKTASGANQEASTLKTSPQTRCSTIMRGSANLSCSAAKLLQLAKSTAQPAAKLFQAGKAASSEAATAVPQQVQFSSPNPQLNNTAPFLFGANKLDTSFLPLQSMHRHSQSLGSSAPNPFGCVVTPNVPKLLAGSPIKATPIHSANSILASGPYSSPLRRAAILPSTAGGNTGPTAPDSPRHIAFAGFPATAQMQGPTPLLGMRSLRQHAVHAEKSVHNDANFVLGHAWTAAAAKAPVMVQPQSTWVSELELQVTVQQLLAGAKASLQAAALLADTPLENNQMSQESPVVNVCDMSVGNHVPIQLSADSAATTNGMNPVQPAARKPSLPKQLEQVSATTQHTGPSIAQLTSCRLAANSTHSASQAVTNVKFTATDVNAAGTDNTCSDDEVEQRQQLDAYKQQRVLRHWALAAKQSTSVGAKAGSWLQKRRLLHCLRVWRAWTAEAWQQLETQAFLQERLQVEKMIAVADRFYRLYRLHAGLRSWCQYAKISRQQRLQEETEARRQAQLLKAEQHKVEVAHRFHRVYMLHACWHDWRSYLRIVAVQRAHDGNQDRRRSKISRFLNAVADQHGYLPGTLKVTAASSTAVQGDTPADSTAHIVNRPLATRSLSAPRHRRPMPLPPQHVITARLNSGACNPLALHHGQHDRSHSTSRVRPSSATSSPATHGSTLHPRAAVTSPVAPRLATAARAHSRKQNIWQSGGSRVWPDGGDADQNPSAEWGQHDMQHQPMHAVVAIDSQGLDILQCDGNQLLGTLQHAMAADMQQTPLDESCMQQMHANQLAIPAQPLQQSISARALQQPHSSMADSSMMGLRSSTNQSTLAPASMSTDESAELHGFVPNSKHPTAIVSTPESVQHAQRLQSNHEALGKHGDAAADAANQATHIVAPWAHAADKQVQSPYVNSPDILLLECSSMQTDYQPASKPLSVAPERCASGQPLAEVVPGLDGQQSLCTIGKRRQSRHTAHRCVTVKTVEASGAAAEPPSLHSSGQRYNGHEPQTRQPSMEDFTDAVTVKLQRLRQFKQSMERKRHMANDGHDTATSPHSQASCGYSIVSHGFVQEESSEPSQSSEIAVVNNDQTALAGNIAHESCQEGTVIEMLQLQDELDIVEHDGESMSAAYPASIPTHQAHSSQASAQPQAVQQPANVADLHRRLEKLRAQESRRRRQYEERLAVLDAALEADMRLLADVHYERSLLRRCGFTPMMRSLRAQHEQATIATHHRHSQLLRCAFHSLHGLLLQRYWAQATRQAVAIASAVSAVKVELRQSAFRGLSLWWKTARLRRNNLLQRGFWGFQRTVSWAWMAEGEAELLRIRLLCRRAIDAWVGVVKDQVDQRLLAELQAAHMADDHYLKRLAARALLAWSEAIAFCRQERLTSQTQAATWSKIQGWLQDLQQQRASREATRPSTAASVAHSSRPPSSQGTAYHNRNHNRHSGSGSQHDFCIPSHSGARAGLQSGSCSQADTTSQLGTGSLASPRSSLTGQLSAASLLTDILLANPPDVQHLQDSQSVIQNNAAGLQYSMNGTGTGLTGTSNDSALLDGTVQLTDEPFADIYPAPWQRPAEKQESILDWALSKSSQKPPAYAQTHATLKPSETVLDAIFKASPAADNYAAPNRDAMLMAASAKPGIMQGKPGMNATALADKRLQRNGLGTIQGRSQLQNYMQNKMKEVG